MSDEPDRRSAVDEQKAIGGQPPGTTTKTEEEERKAAADFARSKSSAGQAMRVKVYSPFRDYYDGQALSVSAVNRTGPFDILPRHHNFISLLSPCDLVVRTGKTGDKKIIISGGIMHVKADQVVVFLDV
jgi:hypothetical protein